MKQWRDKHSFNQQNTGPTFSQNNLWQSYYDSQKQIEQSRKNLAVPPIQLANLLEHHYKICLALQLTSEADKAFQQACRIRIADEKKHWP